MALSKKHFIAMATIIQNRREVIKQTEYMSFASRDGALREIDAIAVGLAGMCAAENPNFDRARFLKACGF